MKILRSNPYRVCLIVFSFILPMTASVVAVVYGSAPWFFYAIFLFLALSIPFQVQYYFDKNHGENPAQTEKSRKAILYVYSCVFVSLLLDRLIITGFTFGALPYDLPLRERLDAMRFSSAYTQHAERETLHHLKSTILEDPEYASRYLPMALYRNKDDPELQQYVVGILEEIMGEPIYSSQSHYPIPSRVIFHIGAKTEAWRRRDKQRGTGRAEVDRRLSETDRMLRQAEGNLDSIQKDMTKLHTIAEAALHQFIDSYYSAKKEGKRERYIQELIQGGDEAVDASFYMMRRINDPEIHGVLFDVIHQIRGSDAPDATFPLTHEEIDRLESEFKGN